ncbi:putative NADP-dependent oxidoreductase YfmJ [Marinithermofilum abyssi]|uniref:Putative NADP-dependent oxidoreductase YfmJ n=1 Tax=Marinithermofilum abyssi TaxID=1571185 RepID=A0A8J2YDF1_9BACL|nr:NADP-dependent oxidoreductase [Marinithermofilum abyssi]GGE25802.1 putative NADP-dependent oxidoreductase YfmJ [Marinithermofilum abyssi]
MAQTNRQILFMQRPKGMPNDAVFQMTETAIPELQEGEVLVRTVYLSVDPYMRGRMNDRKSYIPPFELNQPLTGGVVGQVEKSRHPEFVEGDIVAGMMDWADYSVVKGDKLNKVNTGLAPISTALGVLGMPGLTAYFGLLDIGQPKEGETVVVSGAAGAVGSIVGQIAKLKGCRVVGIAGSQEKVNYLIDELGFDGVINYKTDDVKQALKEACSDGVDVYFDNVGGDISDAVMSLINYQARIVLCGQISLYNLEKPDVGPRMQGQLLINSALMKGFIVRDYQDRFKEGISQLAEWVAQGKIGYRENIVEGLENAPDAFLGLFKGENIGKQLVKVSEVK